MSGEPSARLSGDEILVLKFAAHRQLSRWASKPGCRASREMTMLASLSVRTLQAAKSPAVGRA